MPNLLPDPIIEIVKEADDVRIHTFISSFLNNDIANATHIIESKNCLVIIDSQFLAPYAREFRKYADSLGKPIERLYISHRHPDHWFGLGTAFSDMSDRVYALQKTKDFIEHDGEESRKDHLTKLGKLLAPEKVVLPEITVEGDESETIDGVDYLFHQVVDTEIDFLLTIELPQHGIYIVQDLIYSGTHLYLTDKLDNWIGVLKNLCSSKYELFLPGHGFPAHKDEVRRNILYLETANEALNAGIKEQAFKELLINKFSYRMCAGIFDVYLPRLFDGARQY